MLEITIPESSFWDDNREQFITTQKSVLHLEHSLLSISKWEMIYKKPFLSKEKKTVDETIDYIKCMTLNKQTDYLSYDALSISDINKINEYIEDEKTATTITNMNRPNKQEIITSEIIYYLMFSNGIPLDCQKWHLSRLLMLIQVFSAKNGKPKKKSRKQIAKENSELNAARLKQLNTTG